MDWMTVIEAAVVAGPSGVVGALAALWIKRRVRK